MQLKLGTTRKWAVGYFNGDYGAFSKQMDLVLENEHSETAVSGDNTIVNKRVELFGDEEFESEGIQIRRKRGERVNNTDSEFEEVIEYVDEYYIVVDTDDATTNEKDKRVKVIVNINDIENIISNMKG